LFFLLLISVPLAAQNKPPLEYQVKAAFLFNFTRFINWPSSAFKSDDAPFVIGIAGNDPFGSFLDDIVQGESVGGRPIVIQRLNDFKDVSNCRILFINSNEPATIKEILAATAHRSILTVSDADNFIRLGGAVRFFKKENKIKIEINTFAVKDSQLEVSSKLLSVVKVYR